MLISGRRLKRLEKLRTGDGRALAYTAIVWGVGLSHEMLDIAGVEGFHSPEGNVCGTAMRGADALGGGDILISSAGAGWPAAASVTPPDACPAPLSSGAAVCSCQAKMTKDLTVLRFCMTIS